MMLCQSIRAKSDCQCRWRFAGVLSVAIAWSLLSVPATAAEPPGCPIGISRDTARRLFTVLDHPPAEAECKFEGVGTSRAQLEARWSLSGVPLPPITVLPRDCAPEDGEAVGLFVVRVPTDIGQSCPSVVPLIAEFVKQVESERPVGEVGSVHDPLFRIARLLFACIFIIVMGLVARGVARVPGLDVGWLVMGIASFSAALVLRAALPFSLGNWYSEVMPAFGPPPFMRFGPGYFAFQSLLRDAGLWGPHALVASQVLLGAAALPLLLGVMRELQVGREATAATLVLLIFAPFHARLSATPSEHVLASSLCIGLLFCWLRTARTGEWIWLGLTLLLFPAVCLTRIDMAVPASLTLIWPLLRDRSERAAGLHGRPLCWRTAVVGLVAVSVLILAYRFIVVPSHHPTPDLAGHAFALRYLLPQFWQLATGDPAWISLPAVLLAALGAATMPFRRPLLLVRIAVTLLIAFVALGRSLLPDELLGARYFLFAMAIFLIASGQGFEALVRLAPGPRRAAIAAAGIVLLSLWSGLNARSAYALRYAFQDEYAFARHALGRLPAGCTVYAIPLRSAEFAHDLDCCLDMRRSPLVLDFPQLDFRDLPTTLASAFDDGACVAYYQGVACEIEDDPHDPTVQQRAGKAIGYLRQRCAEVRGMGRLELLDETTTSPRATVSFFAERPHARLYRWTP